MEEKYTYDYNTCYTLINSKTFKITTVIHKNKNSNEENYIPCIIQTFGEKSWCRQINLKGIY